LLDLRRLPNFTKSRILENISKQLFGKEKLTEFENNIILKAWNRSGDYLKATDDRDMEGRGVGRRKRL